MFKIDQKVIITTKGYWQGEVCQIIDIDLDRLLVAYKSTIDNMEVTFWISNEECEAL